MTRGLMAAAATLVFASTQPSAQSPPDFSGTWTSIEQKSPRPCQRAITATQTAATLTLSALDAPTFAPDNAAPPPVTSRRRVINLDGTDTREPIRTAPPRPPEAAPSTWIATTVGSVTRAAWNGHQLVIVTHRTMKVTWPSMMRGEFEREQTIREALSLDASGHLVVDRAVIVDPLPGWSTKQLDFPLSWTCTYGKTQ